jgi:uncharacterized membrane protein
MLRLVTAVVLVAVATIAIILLANGTDVPADLGTNGTGQEDAGPVVRIPVSEVSEEARWFEYPVGGVAIRFFVVLDANGGVHAGMDACEVCYLAKKGFHQEGEMMQCNSCGKVAAIPAIGHNSGDCWPGPVPSRVEGEEVLLIVQALQDGVYMFM